MKRQMTSNICLKALRTACAAMAVAATAIACGQGLPEGYAPLDWIESTGGQYIDTGVDAGANTTIDMSFGHCVYGNGSTLFGKDVWDPQGFLFIIQNDKFRFFGAKGKEPGKAWNLVAKDETEERDYRFTLSADNTARLFGADGRELCAFATDRSTASHHALWLFKCDSPHSAFGEFRLYAMKIGTDAGETLRDFVPARRMNDKAVGLYDRVTKRFFANAGSGAFLVPVLFDDCTFWPATDPQLGKQTDPLPGWGMWGWVPSPGHTMVVDYRTHGALEKYLKDVIARHKDDPRIFMWDLYNEPTNCMQPDRKKYAIDLMRKCFRWAREIGPVQPLTVACWHPNDPKFDEIALAESDIVTFHCYGNAATTRKKIAAMSAPGDSLVRQPRPIDDAEWSALLEFGGFPEPFMRRNRRFSVRWAEMRMEQMMVDDLRTLTKVQELEQVRITAELLANRSGEQIVYDSLARDVSVDPKTAKKWTGVLKYLYYGFEVRPWFGNVENSIRKTPKWYLRDWSCIGDEGKRCETIAACHLLKAVDAWTDLGYGRFELFYLRDKQKREVDFLVSRDGQPWFIAEVKASDTHLSPNLARYQRATGARHAFQVVFDEPFVDADCFTRCDPVVVPARTFLSQLV